MICLIPVNLFEGVRLIRLKGGKHPSYGTSKGNAANSTSIATPVGLWAFNVTVSHCRVNMYIHAQLDCP